MNTNAQTHMDLIWSFQFDKSAATVTIAVAVIALIVLVVFVRRHKKA